MKLDKTHPLVGTWITDEEDSDVALVVSVNRGHFVVSGFCRSDGEPFKVSKTHWDGRALSFDTIMPSTTSRARHVFRLRPDKRIEHELTIWETWKKKDVKPGQPPEAWGVKTTKLPTTPPTLRRVPRRK